MTFGANVGLYTLFAAKRAEEGGVVISIESRNRELRRLKLNVEANSLTNLHLLRNEYGTTSLTDLFEKAQSLAYCETLCYVNADFLRFAFGYCDQRYKSALGHCWL